jgi:hypothetical protein
MAFTSTHLQIEHPPSGVTDSAIIGGWALSLSIRKAGQLGWTGSVDSYESAFYTLRDLAKGQVVPPMKITEFVE